VEALIENLEFVAADCCMRSPFGQRETKKNNALAYVFTLAVVVLARRRILLHAQSLWPT
jgi:hypothetical protein